MPADDYCAVVSRADRLPLCDIYHWSVRQPLPRIPVPLEARDGDVPLELSDVFGQTYERGKYEELLEYSRPLPQRGPDLGRRARGTRFRRTVAALARYPASGLCDPAGSRIPPAIQQHPPI